MSKDTKQSTGSQRGKEQTKSGGKPPPPPPSQSSPKGKPGK